MDAKQMVTLVEKVKRKCYITDNSKLINERLLDIIEDAILKVSELIGIEANFDFSKAGIECELLKNYCFYIWNDKNIKEFEEAYLSDILKLRNKYLIKGEENV